MSILRVSSIQHPSAESPAIELDAVDGVVFSAASFAADAITSGTLASARLPAGSIVAVKSAALTIPFTASLAAGADTEITGLSISHAVANASHKVLVFATVGMIGMADFPMSGIGIALDGVLQQIGDVDGSRARLGSAAWVPGSIGGSGFAVTAIALLTPGATTSKDYAVHAISGRDSTQTVIVNRRSSDGDIAGNPRTASSIIIAEVAA